MKLHTNHANIERGGVQAESAFTIKTNALSFSILSSGLYTDPEMAIVRELSCNAYDAHVAANNQDTPFEIHLPNELEPFLSIKDYGIGLSDEDIQGATVPVMVENAMGEMVHLTDENNDLRFNRTGGLYTTYFDSTKTNSNDFIGALGLGSKSPFSYTDAFEVISRHNGKKRTYAIFLNEEGIPTVAKMGEIDTDEHSGLEVKIAIKQSDFRRFVTKTATALKYFPIKPVVRGALHFEFDAIPEYNIQTEKWMISPSNWGSSITAVQGNVAYRVDATQIKEHLDENMVKLVNNSTIVIYFNIGDLEVSANREEIRYDKRSMDAIVARLKKVSDEFTQEVEKKIGKINTKYWYACIELNELSRKIFNKEGAIRSYIDPDKVKNKTLKRYIEDDGRVGFERILGYDVFRYSVNGYYSQTTKLKRSSVSSKFEPMGTTLVVVSDVKKGAVKRLSEYLNDYNYIEAIVITKRTEPLVELDEANKPLKYIGHKAEFKKLVQGMGGVDIEVLSEITEEPEKVPANRNLAYYSYNGMCGGRTYYSADKISWNTTEHDFDDGGLYFPLKYASQVCIVDDNDQLVELNIGSASNTVDMLRFLVDAYNDKHDTSHTLHSTFALPAATFNKAKKKDNWINLFDFAKEILPDYVAELTFYKSVSATPSILGAGAAIKYTGFTDNIKALPDTSAFKQTMMPLVKGKEKYPNDDVTRLRFIESLYGALFNVKSIPSTPFYSEGAFDEYPMLTLVGHLEYNTQWSALFDYIKLIDRSK